MSAGEKRDFGKLDVRHNAGDDLPEAFHFLDDLPKARSSEDDNWNTFREKIFEASK